MFEHPSLDAIWAKTGPDRSHLPLVLHMIDVAAVAGEIWDQVLTDRSRERIAAGLVLGQDDARSWVLLLAALHDVGKCSSAFQRKATERLAALRDAGIELRSGTSGDVPHGAISAYVLRAELVRRTVSAPIAEAIAVAVGGHHGVLPSELDVRRAQAKRQLGDGSEWQTARAAQLAVIDAVLGTPSAAPTRCDPGALISLAGLISVADWIGSDTSRFPLVPDGATASSAATRLRAAAAAAKDALAAMRWIDRGLPTPLIEPTLEDVVGHPPRELQKATAALLADASGPSLVLLETETGSGKSEAALWAVVSGMARGATGAYVALPTQATANQMHRRMRAAFARVLRVAPDDVGLLHGTAQLAVDEELIDRPELAVDPRDVHDDLPASSARAWFARRKRGLLAPFAVGTIDQALLGVLHVRHFFVRLWGLADAVVVLDEVHAYDAYTSQLLTCLVEWLAACGSTVVLLSATLGQSQRRELLDAYARGAGWDRERTADAEARPRYPRVTVRDARSERSRGVTTVRSPDRQRIELRWSDTACDDVRLAGEVCDAVADGGCIAVVCNTVGLAQARYLAIRAVASAGTHVELFHARMRHCERALVERRIADSFGRQRAGVERPARAIVVATQVIEQSLDVDFDTMWTDLAPIDLLVQRAGRVMRHARPHADGAGLRSARTLQVLVPNAGDPIALLPGSKSVYGEAMLLRTGAVLDGRTAIREPDDLDDLVDRVYDLSVVPAREGPLAKAISAADAAWSAHEQRRQMAGGLAAIASPHDADLLVRLRGGGLPDRDGMGLGTRWEERPSTAAIVLRNGELSDLRTHRPDVHGARELLRRSVRLPFAGSEELRPRSWQESPFLRDHVLVELDGADRAEMNGQRIAWDAVLGVQIERARP